MKYFLLFFITIAFIGCSTPKFEEKNIEKTTEGCSDDCHSININYLYCKRPSAFAEKFNQKIKEEIVQFLLTSKVDSVGKSDISIEEAITAFTDDYKNLNELFKDLPPYEVTLSDSISFQNEKMISLASNRYAFTGGAHGFSATIFLNFDVKTGEIIKNEQLFSDQNSVLKIAEKHFRAEQQIKDDQTLNENGFWFEDNSFHFPQNIGVSKDFLILFYNPYEIAPYASQAFQVKIPMEEVKNYLNYN